MEHLQDFAKNLKELDIKNYKIFGKEKGRDLLDETENRWGNTWREKTEKYFKEQPEKFKLYYPDLYEFVTNKKIQEAAGVVSGYAQSGIGEFIAEVHAGLISGKNMQMIL